jgi:endonuclease/exonuclease/phosphatase family metal-dependent hydrolase
MASVANERLETLRFVTYNVHGCVGADGHVDVPRVVRVLTEVDADVVALQEVQWSDDPRRDQLGRIARVMGMDAFAAATMRRDEDWFGIAILSRVPVVHHERFELGALDGEPRCALRVDLDVGAAIQTAVTTHMGLTVRERWAQLVRLETVLDSLGGGALVLLGDFNAWVPGRDITRRLRQRFAKASWVRSFPALRPLLPLDRIFASPEDAVAALDVHRSEEARRASDHLPVWAEIVRPRAEPSSCTPEPP